MLRPCSLAPSEWSAIVVCDGRVGVESDAIARDDGTRLPLDERWGKAAHPLCAEIGYRSESSSAQGRTGLWYTPRVIFGMPGPHPNWTRLLGSIGLAAVLGPIGCLPHERDVKRDTQQNSDDSEEAPTDEPRKSPEVTKEDQGATRTTLVERAQRDLPLNGEYADDFERSVPGPRWRLTGSGWTIEDGQLCGEKARNHPAWLARRLPTNVVIEFDAISHASAGDIKVELFGDGAGSASGVSYGDATSYIAIFGGWKNHYHVLARLDEHGKDRKVLEVDPSAASVREKPVEKGRTYRFRIERRDGKTLTWFVDDVEMHRFADREPLQGAGHDHFGLNNWEVRVCFDNLRITPL